MQVFLFLQRNNNLLTIKLHIMILRLFVFIGIAVVSSALGLFIAYGIAQFFTHILG